MFRVIDLPCEVDISKAKASFNDGRLEVVMPRAAPARSVRVETTQGLPAEGRASIQETGGMGAAGSPPAVTGANEPIVKVRSASSRR